MRKTATARKATQQENPPRYKKPPPRISLVVEGAAGIASRITPELANAIREAAELNGESLSDFVRVPIEGRVREAFRAAGRMAPDFRKQAAAPSAGAESL